MFSLRAGTFGLFPSDAGSLCTNGLFESISNNTNKNTNTNIHKDAESARLLCLSRCDAATCSETMTTFLFRR